MPVATKTSKKKAPKKAPKRTNRRFTEKQKVDVVARYMKTKLSLSEVAEEFEIYPQMIVRWREILKKHPRLVKITATLKAKAKAKKAK